MLRGWEGLQVQDQHLDAAPCRRAFAVAFTTTKINMNCDNAKNPNLRADLSKTQHVKWPPGLLQGVMLTPDSNVLKH